jgi:hypothetical protein
MIIYCCCCGRQISKNPWSVELQAPFPITYMSNKDVACSDCSRDLDENGMFPEERAILGDRYVY